MATVNTQKQAQAAAELKSEMQKNPTRRKKVILAKGTRVNAVWEEDGEIYPATVAKNFTQGQRVVVVEFDDGDTGTCPIDGVTERRPGRKRLEEEYNNDELHGQVLELLAQLEASTDQDEKKRIRRMLRRRGYRRSELQEA